MVVLLLSSSGGFVSWVEVGEEETFLALIVLSLAPGGGGGQWRKMAMANSAFSFVKFAIFRQFSILEFHI